MLADVTETCHGVPEIDGKNYKQLRLPSEIQQDLLLAKWPCDSCARNICKCITLIRSVNIYQHIYLQHVRAS